MFRELPARALTAVTDQKPQRCRIRNRNVAEPLRNDAIARAHDFSCERRDMTNAVNLTLTADHAGLEREKETVLHVIAEITAPSAGLERERPPLSVVFVLDVSGSMGGEPLDQVKRATKKMIEMLRPDDRVGVVAFSSTSSVVAYVSNADAPAKKKIIRSIDRMTTEAATDIEAGLRMGHAIFPDRRPHERRVIILLSDGVPNQGACGCAELQAIAAQYRKNASTSTLGFGGSHSEPILSAIAEGGGGMYHYIRDPALSQVHFAAALSAQGDVVAESVELSLLPHKDTEILQVIGSDRTRYKAGRLVIDVPDLFARSTHRLAVRLRVNATRSTGPMRLAEATLMYKPVSSSAIATADAHVSVPVTSEASAIAIAPIRMVLLLRAEEERKKARETADRGRFNEAAAILREAVAMIEKLPGFSKDDGSELAEAWDQLRDDADLYHQCPDANAYAEFRRGQRIAGGGNFSAGSAMPESASARAMMNGAAGPLIDAALINVKTAERFPLSKVVNVVGRSRGCEIHVQSGMVSRRSASIVAQNGSFWVEDLGSANGVWMNGAKISKQRLKDGDELLIGDVRLRYEQEANAAS